MLLISAGCFVAAILVGCGSRQAAMGPRTDFTQTANAPTQPTGKESLLAPQIPIMSRIPLRGTLLRTATPGDVLRVAQMPPGSLPSPDEEIWVIARAPEEARPAGEDQPGSGALMAKLPGEEKEIPVPLKSTDVKASIAGYIATVDVTQKFHNPYDEKIEAVYVFPLPQNAAVNEFIMTIGGRRIRGIIREREEARQIYEEARRQGYVASLLTQERANVFTQKVANIEPGKEIDVHIRYFQTLTYADGWYVYVFPMVVGPRFNPPGSTQGVGAVGRGGHGISGQKTEVQYLKPGERSGHDISLSVQVDVGVAIEEMASPTHAVSVTEEAAGARTVTLSRFDAIPNKDFVLRYRVAGKTIKSAMLTHRDQRGGFFTLMLFPPEDLRKADRAPMEMIFVLDCSGSMNGWPIAKAKAATARALRKLGPGDTFQIIRFSNDASQLGPAPIPATPKNVRKALSYLASLQGQGGTMMIKGIKAALDFPHDGRRLRVVSFMTDGYIGNDKDPEILGEVHHRVGASRIFSFGVGSSPNRYLIERMAKIGRGAVAYVGSDSSGEAAVDQFYTRISHPAMTDIAIDWGDMQVTDVYPERTPDLFVGRPVVVTGRFTGKGTSTVRVSGRAAGADKQIALRADVDDAGSRHAGIPAVWARMKIADLADRSIWSSDEELSGEIKRVALDFGLMSAYTAFVAVDSMTRTAGGHGTTVAVPAPVPEGVRYETTVQETAPAESRP